jgi:hypothetical protein
VQLFVITLLAIFASNAFAWGKVGHHVVATLAAAQLTSNARAEVDRLLAMEPGSTLQSISTWADEHRNPATASWHYLNFPRETCSYDAARDCPDGKCVVGAIERQLKILASKGDDENRLKALKYVVHFVADVHQPLHAGFGDDRGGNSYQVQFGGKGTNLHAVWDSGLMRLGEEGVEAFAGRLGAARQVGSLNGTALNLSVVNAAEESCRIVAGPDFYPGRHVGQEYPDRFVPVMEQRLVAAGGRLAGLLNKALK